MTILQVVFDTETTGADSTQADFCQLASVIMVNGTPDTAMTFNRLAKPLHPIGAEAEQVHGISNARVANETSSREVAEQWWDAVLGVADEVEAEGIVLVGHNAVAYDIPIMSRHLEWPSRVPLNTIDTLWAARRLYPMADNHKLGYLAGEFHGLAGRELLDNAHDGLADCWMVALLLDYYRRTTEKSVQEFATWINTPMKLEIIPIGKSKGLPFRMATHGLLKWFAKTPGLDPDIRFTAKSLLWGYGVE